MDPRIVLTERVDGSFARRSKSAPHPAQGSPSVLIATADPEIREAMRDLLERAGLNAIWVSAVNQLKSLIATERIAACLCGFWLQDGTYREVIRHLRRGKIDVPAIIVAPPACPQEYGEYLAAVDLGAIGFLCYPYQQSELESMLEATVSPRRRAAGVKEAPANVDYRDRGAA